MRKVLVFFLFATFCLISGGSSAFMAKAEWKPPQDLERPDSANWGWLSVARGLLSQVIDNVPAQTNLFLEGIKSGAFDEIRSANGKGNHENLKTAINNFLIDHGIASDAVAVSQDLSDGRSLAEKMDLVRTLNQDHGAIAVLKEEQWLLIVEIYDEDGTSKVKYKKTGEKGVANANYEDFFSNGSNVSVISSCCHIQRTPEDERQFSQEEDIQINELPIFEAKNLWKKETCVFCESEDVVCSIPEDTKYHVYRSALRGAENIVANYLMPNNSEFYIKGEDCAPLDAIGQHLVLLTNKPGKEVDLLSAENGTVVQKLDSSDPARITIRGYEIGKFLTDFYGNHDSKCYIKSEDMGDIDEFLLLLNGETFTRDRVNATTHMTKSSEGAPVHSSDSPVEKLVVRIAEYQMINVFDEIRGLSFISTDNAYFASKSYLE